MNKAHILVDAIPNRPAKRMALCTDNIEMQGVIALPPIDLLPIDRERIAAAQVSAPFNPRPTEDWASKRDLVEHRSPPFATAPSTVRDAKIELVHRSGKVMNGFYSNLNRRLCRPAVRRLSHTRVSPNAITFAALLIALLAEFCFAMGLWAFDVAGGVLFFICGLFEEIDGMLARLKFKESAFGSWLETCVDYATYLMLFAGMTIGAYRRGGEAYVWLGAALIFGCVLSFLVISRHRRIAAPPGAPHFLTRKGLLVPYVLLFAVLGATPLFLLLAATGANITWIVTLYFNYRLFLPRSAAQPAAALNHFVPTEVKQ